MGPRLINLVLLITIVIVFITVQSACAIKCFNCISDFDPYCADPFNNKMHDLTDCHTVKPVHIEGSEAAYCRKILQKVDGVQKYIRNCGFLEDTDVKWDKHHCFTKTINDGISMEYCTCTEKDGCNSSNNISLSPLLVFITMLGIFVLRNTS